MDGLFSEQWIGQRGLLAIGVLLVLLAVGYLMKEAFARGWISPALRCAGGVIAGLTAAGIGAHTLRRGLRNYGAALIGLGFGIIYLSLWAASRLFELVPPGLDIAALTLVSLALAVVAYVIDVEALCVAAATGAFFAPVLISSSRNPDGFVLYLAIIGATLGGAAASKHWRYATFVVAASVFGLGMASANYGADPLRIFLLAVLAGTAGLYVGLREGWAETRFLAFAAGWSLLLSADGINPAPLMALGGMVLAAPVCLRGWRSTTIWPDPAGEGKGLGEWSAGETFYFYLTPVFLSWAVTGLAPVWFSRQPGGALLLVGIAYAIPGLSSPRIPFALVAAATWAGAALAQWAGVPAVWALLAMSLAWAATDHLLQRTDGRWYALTVGLLAVLHLVFVDLWDRRFETPAFRDSWAISLWLCIATAMALASGLWRQAGMTRAEAPVTHGRPRAFRESWAAAAISWPPVIPAALWSTAGALLLFGVTGELVRFYAQSSLPRTTAQLARGLSVSAWWAAFAAFLVVLGFVRDLKALRVAGLAVAALAVSKVLLFDLSALDALYRVASVFILGFVSLLLAYLYHRHERIRT